VKAGRLDSLKNAGNWGLGGLELQESWHVAIFWQQKRRIWTAAVEVHNMQSVVTKHLAGFRALTSISWCGAWNMTLLRKLPKKHETNGRSNGTHWFWGINPWLRTQTWIELLF
jgi:hypothetical protein